MPLTPEQIAAAGPWAVLVAILVAGIVALCGLIVKRLLVPGWMYDRSEARAEKSDTQAERNADSLADLAESYKVMARLYDRIELRLERLEGREVNRD